jgi:hypothetical protein
VSDPEQKRKIIGRVFIEVFDEEAAKIPGITHLVQGTLYPDVIESVSFKGPSAVIKSHHNVGGLPERMKLALVEPLRELFKDEVRAVGEALGIPRAILWRQPFPGPGLAIRVLGRWPRSRSTSCAARRDRRPRDPRGGALRVGVAGLRGAAAGAHRRRDGRRPNLRPGVRDPRGAEPGRHDRRLVPAAARAPGADLVADHQRGARASTGWSTTSRRSPRRPSSGSGARPVAPGAASARSSARPSRARSSRWSSPPWAAPTTPRCSLPSPPRSWATS